MSVRQYIGARYVTKIYENSLDPSSAEWEGGRAYEPLTLVTYLNSSYLSKKEVPASVGDPASNPAYWVVTGAYNGQIATLQNQIDQLNDTLYIVGTNAKYQTITDAFNACISNGGGTILITEGVYDEVINAGVVSVPVTFLGTDRRKSIWRSSTGGYLNAPFTGGGNLTFTNLTMYKKAPASQTTEGGYALHLDYPGAEGTMNIIGCDLISEENAALGCGTRTNQQIYVYDTIMRTDLHNGITSVNGALLYHTAPEASQTNQKFSCINSIIHGSSAIANILNSAANDINVDLTLINNYFISDSPTYAQDKLTFDQGIGFVDNNGSSQFIYDVNTLAMNNSNKLNYNKYSSGFGQDTKDRNGRGFKIYSWDDLPINGFISFPSDSPLRPDTLTTHDYVGTCMGYDRDYFLLLVFDINDGKTYVRRKRGGTDSGWVNFIFES